jgi:hypothetical protein
MPANVSVSPTPNAACGERESHLALGRLDATKSAMSKSQAIHPGSGLRGGWLLVAARKVLQRIPRAPLDFNCLYFLEYQGIPPHHAVNWDERFGQEVRGATREDFERLAEKDPSRQLFLKRIDSGDRCVLALRQRRIVGYQWFCEHRVHMEERYSFGIEIPSGSIYTYDAFIFPEHRLSGIWVKFHSLYLRNLMQKLGKSRILTMVDRGNVVSLATHLRFGYRPFRRVLVAKLFGKSFARAREIQKGQSVHACDASMAVLPKPGEERARKTSLASSPDRLSNEALRATNTHENRCES